MKQLSCRALALSAVVAAVGCAGDTTPPPPPATTMARPAAAPATTAPAMVASGDFGVPACDQYMKKYMACVDSKVPEQARAMMRASLEQNKAAWKQAAATPQGRDGLTMACAQAETAAKQAMAAYGCAW
jgi:hypothetical protein